MQSLNALMTFIHRSHRYPQSESPARPLRLKRNGGPFIAHIGAINSLQAQRECGDSSARTHRPLVGRGWFRSGAGEGADFHFGVAVLAAPVATSEIRSDHAQYERQRN